MTAKTTNLLYWIFTILFSALMIFSSITHVLNTKEAQVVLHDQLGYPVYFIPFIGVAKLIGSVIILIPGLKKLKEWAYAGLFFDLAGAVYSGIAVGGGRVDPMMLTLLIWIVPGIISYVLWSKKMGA